MREDFDHKCVEISNELFDVGLKLWKVSSVAGGSFVKSLEKCSLAHAWNPPYVNVLAIFSCRRSIFWAREPVERNLVSTFKEDRLFAVGVCAPPFFFT